MGLNEVGLNWSKIWDSDCWHERVLGKLKTSTANFAWNTTEKNKTAELQPGGVGIVAMDDTAHRVIERGKDPTGLGRWTWVLLEGKQHIRMRIITAY